MFVINSSNSKFIVGKKVVMKRDFSSGNINLYAGDLGYIDGDQVIDVPDMGLLNIRVLDLSFGNQKLHIGEQIAEQYMEVQ